MNDKNKKFPILLDTKNAEKWFKLYKFIPVALFLLLGTFSFILALNSVFDADGGFLTFIFILFLGSIVSALIYCFAKITLSYKILHINYLKKLVKKSSEIEE